MGKFISVLGMNKDPFVCSSTESDIISKISESASSTSFKASRLSHKLAIMCFWSGKISVQVRKICRDYRNVGTNKGYK